VSVSKQLFCKKSTVKGPVSSTALLARKAGVVIERRFVRSGMAFGRLLSISNTINATVAKILDVKLALNLNPMQAEIEPGKYRLYFI
jgi:hypothetical protein